MAEHQQIELSLCVEGGVCNRAQTSPFVARPVVTAGVGRSAREPRPPIGVQPSKRPHRERMPQYATERPILSIFAIAKAVAMVDARLPPCDRASPWTELIPDADLARQELAAPAIVIPRDHERVEPGIARIGERGKRSEVLPWNYRPPLEPEIEQVAVDDERLGVHR